MEMNVAIILGVWAFACCTVVAKNVAGGFMVLSTVGAIVTTLILTGTIKLG